MVAQAHGHHKVPPQELEQAAKETPVALHQPPAVLAVAAAVPAELAAPGVRLMVVPQETELPAAFPDHRCFMQAVVLVTDELLVARPVHQVALRQSPMPSLVAVLVAEVARAMVHTSRQDSEEAAS